MVLLRSAERRVYRRYRFVLDPGSSQTILNRKMAEWLGYPEDVKTGDAEFDTVTGPVPAYTFILPSMIAMSRELQNYEVAAHTFPPKLQIDGVLGLDFFTGTDLSIKLRTGVLELEW